MYTKLLLTYFLLKKPLFHNRDQLLFVQNYGGSKLIGTFQSVLHYFEHRAVHVF